MKKAISLLLALMLCLSLCACGGEAQSNETTEPTAPPPEIISVDKLQFIEPFR